MRDGSQLSKMGTLAQVVAYKEETESEITTLKIRAIGRQRFNLLETRTQIDGLVCPFLFENKCYSLKNSKISVTTD